MRLWSILEAAVDDVTVEVLLNCDIQDLSNLKQLTGRVAEFISLDKRAQSERLTELIKRNLKPKQKRGFQRFQSQLGYVDCFKGVHTTIADVLNELAEVRNNIVHSNLLVDRRLLAECPWLSYPIGSELAVSRDRYEEYVNATAWYLVHIDVLLRKRCGDPVENMKDVEELQADLLKEIAPRKKK